MALNIILYIPPMLMNVKRAIFDILYCLKDYLYFSPAYMHTLLIYAFCNVNDLSWYLKNLWLFYLSKFIIKYFRGTKGMGKKLNSIYIYLVEDIFIKIIYNKKKDKD